MESLTMSSLKMLVQIISKKINGTNEHRKFDTKCVFKGSCYQTSSYMYEIN